MRKGDKQQLYLPSKYIRVVSSLEGFLQLFKLKTRESCSVSTLFSFANIVTFEDVGAIRISLGKVVTPLKILLHFPKIYCVLRIVGGVTVLVVGTTVGNGESVGKLVRV